MPFLRSKRLRKDAEDGEVCWVCLDAADQDSGLVQPCKCPRAVHPVCLARWQLRSAGKGEETHCRFCSERLPDWRQSMTPKAALEVRRSGITPPATMTVAFNGQSHELEVKSGPDGFADFISRVRSLFGIDAQQHMDLTFDCAEPATGQPLQLNGSGAFDAAVHCAAMAAASRTRKRLKRSAIARRLCSNFFARSASCHPIMETAAEAESLQADGESLERLSSAASMTSMTSLGEPALAEPGALIAVQPTSPMPAPTPLRLSLTMDATSPAAKAAANPTALRWGMSPDCERLLWQ